MPAIGGGESARTFPYRGGCAEVPLSGDAFTGPDGQRAGTMDCAVEACSECVCDHVRRSLAGIGNLLMKTGRNTLNETDPMSRLHVPCCGQCCRDFTVDWTRNGHLRAGYSLRATFDQVLIRSQSDT